jgi:ADP-ribose pyrophosphatase
MGKKFTKISEKLIYNNPFWEYKLDKYLLPNLKEGDYHYVETPGSIFIIPKTNDGKFILVRQFRYLNQRFSIEFPGGGINPELSEIDNVKLELSQEAGVSSSKISKIGEFNPFNGVTNEICNVYLAECLTEMKSLPDESEEFEILLLNYDEINLLINRNEIWDGMTLSAWALYMFSNFRS